MAGLEDAIQTALDAHRGQTDKGGHPYILHPLRLMLSMASEQEKIVAILHDVIEDNPDYTIDSIRQAGYPDDICEALTCLTKIPGEVYADFIRRIKPNPLATKVKLADLADNMDITRLGNITESDLQRLSRYKLAWEQLKPRAKP